ncbi:MAG TPA: hypothetical protein DCL77_11305 [Prolixibacteraceae bacterium]|jgi:DNA-binding SARP family transcriptional activator|nr:hypothetical protein [Prolixibacteraceae bacterium]
MNRFILLIILFLNFLFARIDSTLANEVAGGLRFYSQDQEFTKRTSFTLFDDYQPVADSLRLDFDFKIYDSERFGYIFRLIEKFTAESETPLCHFLCHPEFSEGKNTLFFIQNNKKSGKILIAKNDKKWIPFSLRINCLNKTATIICNDSVFKFPIDLPKNLDVNVVFGLLLRNNAEVAAFDIRNVRIKIARKQEFYWPLNEISGTIAHETRHELQSEVKNPNWLIKQHFYWQKIYQNKADVMCGIDFNEKTQDIVLVNQDSLLLYNVVTNKVTAQRYQGKRPFEKDSHFSIINPKTGELISYDFNFLKANGIKAYSIYQPDRQSWTVPETNAEREDNHLHVMFWNNDTSKLIKFGGYAHYKFFNDFKSYDFGSHEWETVPLKGDMVYPRSHAALGKDPANQLYYLFGGLGNKEGEQVLGVQNFYDLYSLDFKNHRSKKLWELDDKSLVFIPRSQMVVEPSDSSFYVVCNQSDKQDAALCLYKFSLKEPTYEIVSDSLPSDFYTISDNAFLFKNDRLEELYCVVRSTPDKQSEAQVTIYKLNYPPTRLTVKAASTNGARSLRRIIVPVCLILGIAFAFLFFRLRKAKDKPEEEIDAEDQVSEVFTTKSDQPKQVISPLVPVTEKEAEEPLALAHTVEYVRPRTNAIWLIGKFSIFDQKGRNITHLCSSKIKSLFFLIFLSTLYDDGINSDELSDVLWPGMDKTRTKNNRSVTMNHLRKIFEDMEGIALVHEDRNWKISFDQSVYIDLVDLQRKKEDKVTNARDIIGLYALGNIIQDDKIAELDKYKGNFESEAVEVLTAFGQEFLDKHQYAICNEIAGIIHTHYDEVNENALELKLAALSKLRNYNKARQEYDNFCQRFKLLMGIEFTVPFSKLTGIE